MRLAFVYLAAIGFCLAPALHGLLGTSNDGKKHKTTAATSIHVIPLRDETLQAQIAHWTAREEVARHIIGVMAPIRIDVVSAKSLHLGPGIDVVWTEHESLEAHDAAMQVEIKYLRDLLDPCPALRRLSPFYPA